MMEKIISSRYVIITDTKDVSQLLDFLEKYKIRAYNYKVIYQKGKIYLRAILSENIILAIENLTLSKAEELFPSSVEESKFYLEFHNVKPCNVSLFNSLSLENAEFHVFNNYVMCIVEGFRCKVENFEVLFPLSEIFPIIRKNFNPFNMNFLYSKDNLLCQIYLKSQGIRDPKEIQYCSVKENKIIYRGKVVKELII